MIKSLPDFNFKGKKVLLRCDFNVPLSENGEVLDDFRIRQSIKTINFLRKAGAKIIIISHLGDPGGKVIERLRLDNVVKLLSEILNFPVKKTEDCIGKEVENEIALMKEGDILLLENIRFHKEEELNEEDFAKELARMGDIYINEAFSVCHRNHASIVGIPENIGKAKGAGFLLKKEIDSLSYILNNPARPLVAIIGGIKISTKIRMIEKFMNLADHLLVGGGIANVILISKGLMEGNQDIGESVAIDLSKIDITSPKLHLPLDGLIKLKEDSLVKLLAIGKIQKDEMVYDIGKETIYIFREIIKTANTIVWNGPLGLSNKKRFENGTMEIAMAIAENKKAFKVAGGGETIEAINKFNLLDKFNHVSTGGGAMLDFLGGQIMPGIESLDI